MSLDIFDDENIREMKIEKTMFDYNQFATKFHVKQEHIPNSQIRQEGKLDDD